MKTAQPRSLPLVSCSAAVARISSHRGTIVLTEQEVSRSWRQLFGKGEIAPELVSRGEALLEELRPESPLRHRLLNELEELQNLAAAKNAPPKTRARRKKQAVAS